LADFTVLIVARNRAETLPTCLAHLEQQTYPAGRYDVLVVDDGSQDATPSVVERYAAGAPVPTRCIVLPHVGGALARSAGVEQASGRWIVFLDQDLLASPHLLERYAEAMEPLGEGALVQGAVRVHPQMAPDTLTRCFLPEDHTTPENPLRISPWEWNGYNFAAARELLQQYGGFTGIGQFPDALEHEFAHRLAGQGVFGQFAERALAYEWRPVSFDSERARFYRKGYALGALDRELGQDIPTVGPARRGPQLRSHLDRLLMPIYVRACRRAGEDFRYVATFYRRVLRLEGWRGYRDALAGRLPRAHAAN